MRTETFKFRISPVEEDALKTLAQKHGVTPSEFLRDLLRKAAQQAGILPEVVISQPEVESIAA